MHRSIQCILSKTTTCGPVPTDLYIERWLLDRGRLQWFSAIWGQGSWLYIEVAALHSDYFRQVPVCLFMTYTCYIYSFIYFYIRY